MSDFQTSENKNFFDLTYSAIKEYHDLHLSKTQQESIEKDLKNIIFENNVDKDHISVKIHLIECMKRKINPISRLTFETINISNFYCQALDGSKIHLLCKIVTNFDKNKYLGYYVPPEGNYDPNNLVNENYRIVKWVDFSEKEGGIYSELTMWNKLKDIGFSHPDIETNYTLWGEKVLVMKRLISLNYKNYNKIGINLLDQLKVLHKIGVHNDIKPENIMYDHTNDKYTLINLDSVTTTDLYYGYKRKVWNKIYTSQAPDIIDQITNPKYDLIELVFVLKTILHYDKTNNKNKDKFEKDCAKLREYYNYAIQLDERIKHFSDLVYDDLKKILLS